MLKFKNGLHLNKDNEEPWQIKLFSKTLKKKMKIHALNRLIGDATGLSCLLITCGDNNGALNYYIRETGGKWYWADLEEKCIKEMEQFLSEPVLKIDKSTCKLSFPEGSFDYVVTIDCHEHLNDPATFNQELKRVTKANGRVIVTVPNGDEKKLATRIKTFIGMTKEKYGHVVEGYDIHELKDQLSRVGLKPGRTDSYSRFFTEIIELAINFAYVKFLSKKDDVEVENGTIAPSNEEQLRSVKKTYRLYSYIYPVIRILSLLDCMFFFTTGYAVIVEGKKA